MSAGEIQPGQGNFRTGAEFLDGDSGHPWQSILSYLPLGLISSQVPELPENLLIHLWLI